MENFMPAWDESLLGISYHLVGWNLWNFIGISKISSESFYPFPAHINACACKGWVFFKSRYPVGVFSRWTEKNFRPLIIYQKFFRPLNFSPKIFRPLKFLEEIFTPLNIFRIPSFFNRIIFTSLKFISLELILCEEIFVCEEIKSLFSTTQFHASLAFQTNFQTPYNTPEKFQTP